jgi:hypothetical protein
MPTIQEVFQAMDEAREKCRKEMDEQWANSPAGKRGRNEPMPLSELKLGLVFPNVRCDGLE